MIALKNPAMGAAIKDVVINVGLGPRKYSHPVGKTLVYDDRVGREMQEKYPFLELDEPTESTEEYWKCKYCEYRNKVKVAIYGHMRKNHKDQEQVAPDKVGQNDVSGELNQGEETISPIDAIQESKRQMWEETKAIQSGTVDRDGVEWTGSGLEADDGKE